MITAPRPRITCSSCHGYGSIPCVSYGGEQFAFELKLSGKKALEDGKSQMADY